MTNHYARTRRNRGAWYEALQVNQAIATGHPLDDIRDFDDAVTSGTISHVLIAADNPAPARGYALVFHTSDAAYARMHVLDKEPDEVYRALMSQARVQVDYLTQRTGTERGLPILVDTETLAQHVAAAIVRLGEPYGVTLNDTEDEDGDRSLDALLEATPQTIAEQTADAIHLGVAATGGVTVWSDTEPRVHTVVLLSFTPGDDSDTTEHIFLVEHGEPLPPQPAPEPVNGYTFEAWVNGHDFQPYDFTEPVTEDREITQAWVEPEAENETKTDQADTEDPKQDTDAPATDTGEANTATPTPDAPAPPTGDTYACTEFGCTKTFGTARGLKIHTNTHTK